MNIIRCSFGVAILLPATAACNSAAGNEPPQHVAMRAEFTVVSDPNQGLAGVALQLNGETLATTDQHGHASLKLRGTEGESADIAVRCPTGHESPAPLHLALRRFSEASSAPRFDARCAPTERTVVVGIRAENGGDLAVKHLGKALTRTDSTGVAHAVMRVRPNEQVTLQLDTTTASRGRLRPENPTLTFVAKDRDDVVILDQHFDTERVIVKTAAPSLPGPRRL